MSTDKISIIIISYKSNKYLKKLFESFKFIAEIIDEIIVVNNSNTEKIKLPSKEIRVKIINNKTNIGFAAAVNKAIKVSRNDNLLLLNPDTYLIDSSIVKMFKYFIKRNNLGAIGGKILTYDQQGIQFTATSKPSFFTGLFEFTILKRIFPNNFFSNKFWVENNKITSPTKVFSLCGAFILFRKYLHNNLNMFDERYFLYLEDIQFGCNINKNNYDLIFYPDSKIAHYGGGSTNNKYKTDLNSWYTSRNVYFKNNINLFSSIILLVLFKAEWTIITIVTKIKNELTKSQPISPPSNPQFNRKS